MNPIKLNTQLTNAFFNETIYNQLSVKLPLCHQMLLSGTGKGNEFTGWTNIPDFMPDSLINDIIEKSNELKRISETVVVIGIGGSYLGAKAIIEALKPSFPEKEKHTEVLFAGFNLSEDYHAELLEYLNKRDYSLVVISKSGTTTEPAIAFRLLFKHLIEKYGESNIQKRVICITDVAKGALRKMVNKYGFSSFVIPDNIGGRFSVLTAVGLLPVAIAGFDIKLLLQGATDMMNNYKQHFTDSNYIINDFALHRLSLERQGYYIELFATYQPRLFYFMEWLKQLLGESEGKEGKGLYPSSVVFTTDLHSLGQYIQEGKRIMFEIVLHVTKPLKNLNIPLFENDDDDLNYLAGKNIGHVNDNAMKATQMAHIEGNVPNIEMTIPELSEYYLGQMIYMFEVVCAISGYLNNINPFNQPGVEAYKKNMFKLLGKPGL